MASQHPSYTYGTPALAKSGVTKFSVHATLRVADSGTRLRMRTWARRVSHLNECAHAESGPGARRMVALRTLAAMLKLSNVISNM